MYNNTTLLKLGSKTNKLKSHYDIEDKYVFFDWKEAAYSESAWQVEVSDKLKVLMDVTQKKMARQAVASNQTFENKEAMITLQQLEQTLNIPVPSYRFFDALKCFLENKWNRIKSTQLRYTSLPNTAITSLALAIAKELHKKNQAIKVYQYLMPTIQWTEDVLGILEKGNVDDYNLDELILAENSQSLIPVQEVLDILNPKSNITFKHLTNPFDPENPYSQDEIQRLINFSSLTQELHKVWRDINSNKECGQSIGWHLEQLVNQLRKGGAQGGYGGSEENAGEPALTGIVDFFSYFKSLPEELQINALFKSPNNSRTSLNEIINILTKEDTTSFDCVEMQTYIIEDILRDNQELYSMGSITSIEVLQAKFEKIKQSLSETPQGCDKPM